MKIIEKLADRYTKSTKGYDEYYENGYCQSNYEDVRDAFCAGFRKAREMALDLPTDGRLPLVNLGEEDIGKPECGAV